MKKAVLASSALLITTGHAIVIGNDATLQVATASNVPTLRNLDAVIAAEPNFKHPTGCNAPKPPTFYARNMEATTISTITSTSTVFATVTSTLDAYATPSAIGFIEKLPTTALDSIMLNEPNPEAQPHTADTTTALQTNLVTVVGQSIITVFKNPGGAGVIDYSHDSGDKLTQKTQIHRPAENALPNNVLAASYTYATTWIDPSTTTAIVVGITPPSPMTGYRWSIDGGAWQTSTTTLSIAPSGVSLAQSTKANMLWLVAMTTDSVHTVDTSGTPSNTKTISSVSYTSVDISTFVATGSATWTDWPFTFDSPVTPSLSTTSAPIPTNSFSIGSSTITTAEKTTSSAQVTDFHIGSGAVTATLFAQSESGVGSLNVSEGLTVALATAIGLCVSLVLVL